MFKDHSELLKQRGETLLTELKQLVDQGLPDQEKLHADAVKLWGTCWFSPVGCKLTVWTESKQSSALAKWQEEMQQAQANQVPQEQLPPKPVSLSFIGLIKLTTRQDLPPPPKRYKWNDAIKENVWQQVCMCNELAALANEAQ